MANFEFYIAHGKYQHYSDKALDWWIKSWKLKAIDKEIALLYRKKYNIKAISYLKKSLKHIDG